MMKEEIYKTYLTKLQTAALSRKPGYLDEALAIGKKTATWIEFTPEQFHYLRAKYSLPPQPKIPTSLTSFPSVQSQPDPGPASVAFRKRYGLGNAVHAVAGPVGRAIGWPCVKKDGTTDLISGSPCDRFRQTLNKISL